MRYSWILFDADDTLFDFQRAARQSFDLTLAAFRIPAREESWEAYERINKAVWLAFERQEITAMELRRVRFERFLEAIGHEGDALSMNAHYLQALSQARFMISGAVELITFLAGQGIRLGLITNGLREVQRPRFEGTDLCRRFEVIVVSDEIGVAKPQSAFFEHAFQAMGQPPKASVLVVGDSLHSDIQGGNAFGLHTCWYNPGAMKNESAHAPTYEIQRLEALKPICLGRSSEHTFDPGS
jgi:2-haloacid dehalogenase